MKRITLAIVLVLWMLGLIAFSVTRVITVLDLLTMACLGIALGIVLAELLKDRDV